ncbi:hypothetical protein BB558_002779 [Smittium angustum]|uniref:Uncharacterized protein n=1 Tax=Smittium angustum TaxID=133377 RepID=A0A2U1J7S9_SMIAN|nr:hypothetical protein BB558_002779 [Smittium angustum]
MEIHFDQGKSVKINGQIENNNKLQKIKKTPDVGIEPTTLRLKASRSTIELTGQEVLPRVELGLLDSKSNVMTVRP